MLLGNMEQRFNAYARIIVLQAFVVLLIAAFGIVIMVELADVVKIGPTTFSEFALDCETDLHPVVVVGGDVESAVLDFLYQVFYVAFYAHVACDIKGF